MVKRVRLKIAGRVQGVGFRPTVVRLAQDLGLTGTVCNDTSGVSLELQGTVQSLATFSQRLQGVDKPPLAQFVSFLEEKCPIVKGESVFRIIGSRVDGDVRSEVAVDTALCADCLREMRDPADFRYRYPFINCTNCGPRYSIIKTVPYDRPGTTMADFALCPQCESQYGDIGDRRYHAQPVACTTCGPHIWLTDTQGKELERENDACLQAAAALLRAGKILAIKGLGGFHLAVDALNDKAVERLRLRKQRDHKPFALMTNRFEKMEPFVHLSDAARQLLESPQSPIVLLPRRLNDRLPQAVAPGMDTLGMMLCYAPLHVLLFAEGLELLVMTSGNIADEPLICDNQRALERLGPVADAFLLHDRDIYRQVDDSIVHWVNRQPMLLRRARGYMPTPIRLSHSTKRHILAAGADLKNTFCLAKGDQLICSEHIGDLADAEVYQHYIRSIQHLRALFEVEPTLVVHDAHPAYFSTQYAQSLDSIETLAVQHHWAHIAAVLAEHQHGGPVIGLVADGTGYGSDGAIWGGECLICSLTEFERFGHMKNFILPGGDQASKEAIRPLMGLLHQAFGNDFTLDRCIEWLALLGPDQEKLSLIDQQLNKNLNCVPTSSMGRMFDALAVLLGVGSHNFFDAQLPMGLEVLAGTGSGKAYPVVMLATETGLVWDWTAMIQDMIVQVRQGAAPVDLAFRFHHTLTEVFCQWACLARERFSLSTVALGGGVFCNRRLIGQVMPALEAHGFEVLIGRQLPANDGCISVGQAAIGSRTLS